MKSYHSTKRVRAAVGNFPNGSGRLKMLAGSTLAAIVFSLAAHAHADTIKLLPDRAEKAGVKQYSGQITAETANEVKIKLNSGKEETVPVSSIDTVAYDGTSPNFLRAESRLNAGALAEAADLFQKASGESKGKVTVERAALYGRARALTDLAQVDQSKAAEAADALEAFAKAHPSSRQIGPALTALIRLRLNQGDVAKAEKAVNDLKANVKLSPDQAKDLDLSSVYQARILEKKGDHDAALKALDLILADAGKGSTRAREALLAKAESLAATQKFQDAESAVREVIAQSGPEDMLVQAEAYNTLGDCLKAAGRPKEALMAYLKTDILYEGAKEQHARALAQIVELWRTLKQDGRANEVQERLRQLYPQSPYARPKAAR